MFLMLADTEIFVDPSMWAREPEITPGLDEV
jgi:hypothetical protein